MKICVQKVRRSVQSNNPLEKFDKDLPKTALVFQDSHRRRKILIGKKSLPIDDEKFTPGVKSTTHPFIVCGCSKELAV